MRKKVKQFFKFQPFSQKQRKVLNWWCSTSPVKDAEGIIADGAILDDGVEVGPFCYVGPNVRIGAGTRLIGHCNIDGHTTLGTGNVIHPFSALGQPAQDHAVEPGAATYLEIGNDNVFREGTTAHTGTKPGTTTVIGNHNMFMNSCHVAHNCRVGNNVIYVGCACTAGYCEIMDNALISGLVGLHQFCRVGRFAIIRSFPRTSRPS